MVLYDAGESYWRSLFKIERYGYRECIICVSRKVFYHLYDDLMHPQLYECIKMVLLIF